MTTISAAPAALAARMFRGFADPPRVAILPELLPGARRVSDLVDAVGSSQSNVAGHLACLKGCGMVVDRADRKSVVLGKRGPGSVDLGGGRRIKKQCSDKGKTRRSTEYF